MSLSTGGGWVMLHISTREPSFSCRLGLYVPWVARRFRATTRLTEVRMRASSRTTDTTLIDSKRSEVKPSEVSWRRGRRRGWRGGSQIIHFELMF